MNECRNWNALAAAAVVMALAVLIVACGSSEDSTRVLSAAEAKHLLLELPYRYHFRKVAVPQGASGALAGTAIGDHHTVLHFGISLGGEPDPVSVPQAGTEEAYGYPRGGFVFTDDLQVRGKHEKWEPAPQFRTAAQWNEAGHMEVAMEETLCRAATGEPCHEG